MLQTAPMIIFVILFCQALGTLLCLPNLFCCLKVMSQEACWSWLPNSKKPKDVLFFFSVMSFQKWSVPLRSVYCCRSYPWPCFFGSLFACYCFSSQFVVQLIFCSCSVNCGFYWFLVQRKSHKETQRDCLALISFCLIFIILLLIFVPSWFLLIPCYGFLAGLFTKSLAMGPHQ